MKHRFRVSGDRRRVRAPHKGGGAPSPLEDLRVGRRQLRPAASADSDPQGETTARGADATWPMARLVSAPLCPVHMCGPRQSINQQSCCPLSTPLPIQTRGACARARLTLARVCARARFHPPAGPRERTNRPPCGPRGGRCLPATADRDSPSGPGVCPGDDVTSRAPWRDGKDFGRQQHRAPSASATGWPAVGPQGRRLPPIDPDRLGVGLGSDSSMAVPVWARPSHGLCFGKRRDGAATETLLRPTPCNSTTSGSPPAGRRESRGGPPRPGRCRGPWRLGSGRTSDGTPPQANPRANMAF